MQPNRKHKNCRNDGEASDKTKHAANPAPMIKSAPSYGGSNSTIGYKQYQLEDIHA